MMGNNSYYEVGRWKSMTTNIPSSNINSSVVMLSSSTLSPTHHHRYQARKLACNKSHKEAERRRRKRINAHLATLRSLLPNLLKTDKASVLGEAVRRVRELKKAASELTSDDLNDGDASKSCLLPGDMDEVNLRRSENDNTTLVATLCCEDRPELIVDLTRALRSVKGAKVVRAKMATVGGRTKSVLWVRGLGGSGGGGGGFSGPEGLLRRALKVVVDKPSPSSSSDGMGHFGLMLGSRLQCPYYF